MQGDSMGFDQCFLTEFTLNLEGINKSLIIVNFSVQNKYLRNFQDDFDFKNIKKYFKVQITLKFFLKMA